MAAGDGSASAAATINMASDACRQRRAQAGRAGIVEIDHVAEAILEIAHPLQERVVGEGASGGIGGAGIEPIDKVWRHEADVAGVGAESGHDALGAGAAVDASGDGEDGDHRAIAPPPLRSRRPLQPLAEEPGDLLRDRRMVLEEAIEVGLGDAHQIAVASRRDGGGSRLVEQEGHLADERAAADRVDQPGVVAGRLDDDLQAAARHDPQRVGAIALAAQDVPSVEVHLVFERVEAGEQSRIDAGEKTRRSETGAWRCGRGGQRHGHSSP